MRHLTSTTPPQYGATFIALLFNFICVLVAWGEINQTYMLSSFFFSLIYLIIGVPLGWYLWYMRLYRAMMRDGALSFGFFFLMFLVHIAFCVYTAVSPSTCRAEGEAVMRPHTHSPPRHLSLSAALNLTLPPFRHQVRHCRQQQLCARGDPDRPGAQRQAHAGLHLLHRGLCLVGLPQRHLHPVPLPRVRSVPQPGRRYRRALRGHPGRRADGRARRCAQRWPPLSNVLTCAEGHAPAAAVRVGAPYTAARSELVSSSVKFDLQRCDLAGRHAAILDDQLAQGRVLHELRTQQLGAAVFKIH